MEDNQTTDTTTYTMSNTNAEKAEALRAKVRSLSPEKINSAFTALLQTSNGEGRPVDLNLANGCLELYKAEMIRRLILVNGDPVPPVPANDILIGTHFVRFSGQGLKEWVLEQYYGPIQEDTVDFKLANGIYTEEILEEYFPGNEPEKAKRRNRITIFIIPFEKNTLKMFAGGSAYDLGGLEP